MLTIIENVLDPDNAKSLHDKLAVANWVDGLATAGSLSASVKQNQQLAESDTLARSFGDQILRLVTAHPTFVSAALPLKMYPPKFNRYTGGGSYGPHVDSAVMRLPDSGEMLRTDLSATLFLTDPDSYDGGELIIETAFGAQPVKLAAGDMVLYPASSLHHVTPVTKGARISCFFWVQSMVQMESQRSHLFDLDQTIQALAGDLPAGDDRLLNLTGLYHNLLRDWSVM